MCITSFNLILQKPPCPRELHLNLSGLTTGTTLRIKRCVLCECIRVAKATNFNSVSFPKLSQIYLTFDVPTSLGPFWSQRKSARYSTPLPPRAVWPVHPLWSYSHCSREYTIKLPRHPRLARIVYSRGTTEQSDIQITSFIYITV